MEPGPVTVTVRMKATRTVVHDIALTISLPAALAADPREVRRHIEELQPGVLSAECTDDTVDRITDVALLDVIGINVQASGDLPGTGGGGER